MHFPEDEWCRGLFDMNVGFFHAFLLRNIYLVHLPIIKTGFYGVFAVDLCCLCILNNNLLRKVDWPVFSSVECLYPIDCSLS